MTDFMPPRVGVPLPKNQITIFYAFTFFIFALGFAAGFLVAKYLW